MSMNHPWPEELVGSAVLHHGDVRRIDQALEGGLGGCVRAAALLAGLTGGDLERRV